MELWVGCVAGALEESNYRSKLSGAGLEGIDLEPTRIYRAADAKQFLEDPGLSDDATIAQIDGRIMSAFVRAQKPAAAEKLTPPLEYAIRKLLIVSALRSWLAALDDFRNWLIREAA